MVTGHCYYCLGHGVAWGLVLLLWGCCLQLRATATSLGQSLGGSLLESLLGCRAGRARKKGGWERENLRRQ